MGCSASAKRDLSVVVVSSPNISYAESRRVRECNDDVGHNTKWKIKMNINEARRLYEHDGTLPADSSSSQLELRGMLADSIALPLFANYAKRHDFQDTLNCWNDIQNFKLIPQEDDSRLLRAVEIMEVYIDSGLIINNSGTGDETTQSLLSLCSDKYEQIKIAPDKDASATAMYFNDIQRYCFASLHSSLFSSFKKTEEYMTMTRIIRESYNYVRLHDFDYYEKLGQGGFGIVVHCVKKSTGQHFAMKIQTKRGLLAAFADDPWRAEFEKQALVAAHHPYIVNLDYSFQTPAFAIMVLGLGAADLRGVAIMSSGKVLNPDHACFYAAEIVSAIGELHSMGIMYRDLKPSNVIINFDGHVQLADFGAIADADGVTLGIRDETDDMAPIFSASERSKYGAFDNDGLDADADADGLSGTAVKRAMTVIGTYGYMAPEMVVILSQKRHQRIGYTNAVDWWSLGCTLYKLLSGTPVFPDFALEKVMNIAPQYPRGNLKFVSRYGILFQDVKEHPNVPPVALDFIKQLLRTDERQRLGYGPGGLKKLKAHSYFKGLDWARLEANMLDPPTRFPMVHTAVTPLFPSFNDMMIEYGKEGWLGDFPKWNQQRYFATWDYISPRRLREECGVYNSEMEMANSHWWSRSSNNQKNNKKGAGIVEFNDVTSNASNQHYGMQPCA